MKLTRTSIFAVCSSFVVVLGISAGMLVIGSPGEARKKRLDELRVQDLRAISSAMENFRRTHDTLPETLDQLLQPNGPYGLRLSDPESMAAYEYRAKGSEMYELCAQFQTTLDASEDNNAFWRHGPGRTCFQIEMRSPAKARPEARQ